jgi:hypothetical protein
MSAGLRWRRRMRGYAPNPHRPARGRLYSRRRHAGGSGRRAAGGAAGVNMFARLGFAVRGIACIVIGVIAIMVALRVARDEPDNAGALEAIAAQPLGYLLLWILVIGYLGLAVWRFVQAADKRLNPAGGHRVKALVCGIGYAIAFLTTLMLVVDGTRGQMAPHPRRRPRLSTVRGSFTVPPGQRPRASRAVSTSPARS